MKISQEQDRYLINHTKNAIEIKECKHAIHGYEKKV